MKINGYAVEKVGGELNPYGYDSSALGDQDVLIEITHCGICHSDIHLIDDDWKISNYPFIPGHEIVGNVKEVGKHCNHLSVGQRVGVGWQCGSCFHCQWCMKGEENCCLHYQPTCVGRNGGFAQAIVVDGRFAFPIPEELESAQTAPLLCGGATVYSPLRRYRVNVSSRVGVIGIGGLGHMAIQFAKAMGAHVTAFSSSPSKESEAMGLGADEFVTEIDKFPQESLDFIISTSSAKLDWVQWMNCLQPKGVFCFVGAAPGNLDFGLQILIAKQRSVVGSLIGDRHTIVEMLKVAAEKNVRAKIEEFPLEDVNTALDRVRKNQVRYRAVLKI
ncbi:MAG: Aldehyde reductase Ahr [Chlamydiae bacterium]|nr:Aldehyde reductase Ahr [Chlamydiota bacterium]